MSWRDVSAAIDLERLVDAHAAAGVTLIRPVDDEWPERLADDPEPPLMLCVRGDLSGLLAPTCGIVGTRGCTPDGRRVAFALARDLAAAGIAVVSGLALGIDAAAHRGCLAPHAEADPASGLGVPIGVVAGGLDRVYPPSHVDLYGSVAARGALLSEVPLGTRPERWRFPARNRLIAALADIVVVVESAPRGGSLHTVEAALERDRIVGAVPGPVTSVASEGTNALLADGALVVRGVDDVLLALGLQGRLLPLSSQDAGEASVALERLGPDAVAVYGAVGVTATPLERVVTDAGLAVGRALSALQVLANAGFVDDSCGEWTRIR